MNAVYSEQNSPDRNEPSLQVGLALGVGKQYDPFITDDDEPFYAFLDLAYYGSYGFFDNGDLGLYLKTTETLTFNLIASRSNDRNIFEPISHLTRGMTLSESATSAFTASDGIEQNFAMPNDSNSDRSANTLATIPPKKASIDAGFEFIIDINWGVLHSQWLTDISDTHNGNEFWVSYSNQHKSGKHIFSYSLALIQKNKEYINYYYGISETESNNVLPVYQGKESTNWQAKIAYSYPINERLSIAGFVVYEKFGGGIYQSPIIHDTSVSSLFAGLYYRFH